MPPTAPNLPARLWLVPHAARTVGDPTVRPLLAQALDCEPDAVPLWRDPRGRPRLGAPCAHLDVGWSHSGELLVLALGEAVQLGVDLEKVRSRPRLAKLAQRFFQQDETRWLQAQPEQSITEAFVRIWCAKEAVLKAHGHGVSFGLHRLAFAQGRDGALRMVECDPALGAPSDWTLHEWMPTEGYRAALAWRPR